MAYYKDLEPCDYFGPLERLKAVGWLDQEHPYSTGPVSRQFFRRLAGLLVEPWQPFALAGVENCCLCRFTGGPAEIHFEGTDVSVGSSCIFVPTEDTVYVAPSMVIHYVDAHNYCPPGEFQEAVAKCPEMRTMSYLRLIKKHGVYRLASPE